MNDVRLTRHLAVIVVIKIAVLATLWFAFFRGPPAGIDADHVLHPGGAAIAAAGDEA